MSTFNEQDARNVRSVAKSYSDMRTDAPQKGKRTLTEERKSELREQVKDLREKRQAKAKRRALLESVLERKRKTNAFRSRHARRKLREMYEDDMYDLDMYDEDDDWEDDAYNDDLMDEVDDYEDDDDYEDEMMEMGHGRRIREGRRLRENRKMIRSRIRESIDRRTKRAALRESAQDRRSKRSR